MISSFQVAGMLSGILEQTGKVFQIEKDEVEKARREWERALEVDIFPQSVSQ
jgi:hypothetical protein